MKFKIKWQGLLLAVILIVTGTAAWAADRESFVITIKDHQFSPLDLTVPVGKKVKVQVDNQDPTPEEFESFDLNREKVVAGNAKIIIYIGPLKAGRYAYFGDFHKDTAQGFIVAQ